MHALLCRLCIGAVVASYSRCALSQTAVPQPPKPSSSFGWSDLDFLVPPRFVAGWVHVTWNLSTTINLPHLKHFVHYYKIKVPPRTLKDHPQWKDDPIHTPILEGDSRCLARLSAYSGGNDARLPEGQAFKLWTQPVVTTSQRRMPRPTFLVTLVTEDPRNPYWFWKPRLLLDKGGGVEASIIPFPGLIPPLDEATLAPYQRGLKGFVAPNVYTALTFPVVHGASYVIEFLLPPATTTSVHYPRMRITPASRHDLERSARAGHAVAMSHAEFDELRFLSGDRLWIAGDDILYGLTEKTHSLASSRQRKKSGAAHMPGGDHSFQQTRGYWPITSAAPSSATTATSATSTGAAPTSAIEDQQVPLRGVSMLAQDDALLATLAEKALEKEAWSTFREIEALRSKLAYTELGWFYAHHKLLFALLYEQFFEEAIRFAFATLDVQALRIAFTIALRRMSRAVAYFSMEVDRTMAAAAAATNSSSTTGFSWGACDVLRIPIMQHGREVYLPTASIPLSTDAVLQQSVEAEIVMVDTVLLHWTWRTYEFRHSVHWQYAMQQWTTYCTKQREPSATTTPLLFDPAIVLREVLRDVHGRAHGLDVLVDALRSPSSIRDQEAVPLLLLETADLVATHLLPDPLRIPVSTTVAIRWKKSLLPARPEPLYDVGTRADWFSEERMWRKWGPFHVNISSAIMEKTYCLRASALQVLGIRAEDLVNLQAAAAAGLATESTGIAHEARSAAEQLELVNPYVHVNLSSFPRRLEHVFVSYREAQLQTAGKLLLRYAISAPLEAADTAKRYRGVNEFLHKFNREYRRRVTEHPEPFSASLGPISPEERRMRAYMKGAMTYGIPYAQGLGSLSHGDQTHTPMDSIRLVRTHIKKQYQFDSDDKTGPVPPPPHLHRIFRWIELLVDDLQRITVENATSRPGTVPNNLPIWDNIQVRTSHQGLRRQVTFLLDQRDVYTYFFRNDPTRYEPQVWPYGPSNSSVAGLLHGHHFALYIR